MSVPNSQSEDPAMQTIKCTVVGDLDAKVAELLRCFTTSTYATETMPTVFRDYAMTLMIRGKPYTLGMFDATGQMNEGQRVLSYSQTDVFLVCFSVVSPSSFQNAQKKWIPEVVKHCPKRPFFLVGTQIHLRSDEATIGELWKCNQVPVSQIAAEQAANELRAMKYIECSDWTLEGLTEVFDEFILQSLTRPKAPSKWSSFLHPKVAFPILRSRSKIKSSHSVTENLDTLADKHNTIKCVVVADSAVKTTALLVSYTSNTYHTEYEPTVFDTYSVTVMVDKEPYTLGLIDVSDAGHRQYKERIYCYSRADIFLVCFSVVSPSSFENIRNKWIPEITHYCPGIPFIVVGTDTHLREDAVAVHQLSRQGLKPVTANSAVSLAQELNAVKYMECSVKTYHGLKNVFDEAVLVALTYDRPRKRKTFFEHFRKKPPKKKAEARIQSDVSVPDGRDSEWGQQVQSPILKPIIRVTPEPTQVGDEISSKDSQTMVDGSEMSHPDIPGTKQGLVDSEVDHNLPARSLSPEDTHLLSPLQAENEAPTMMELVAFPTSEGVINIPAEIDTKYKEFGDLLLEGDSGYQEEDITSGAQDPVEINTMILRKWLRGSGRSPVSWATLAEVLECIDMARLAYQIRYAKMSIPLSGGASALSPAEQVINYRHSLACSIQ